MTGRVDSPLWEVLAIESDVWILGARIPIDRTEYMMMKMWMCMVVFGLMTGSALADTELSGEDIVRKASSQNQVGLSSGEATMLMDIRTPEGEILKRRIRIRAASDNGLSKLRMTFVEPQDQRGIEVLMLEQKDGANLQYLYLPSFKKVRRISGSAKNGRFEGSDFTYADMESRKVSDGTYKRLPDETYGKQPVYRVDGFPKKKADEKYSLVQMWISKKAWLPLKVVFYDLKSRPAKHLKVKRLKKVNGRYVVTKAVMKNLLKGSETELSITGIDGNVVFPSDAFLSNSLGK